MEFVDSDLEDTDEKPLSRRWPCILAKASDLATQCLCISALCSFLSDDDPDRFPGLLCLPNEIECFGCGDLLRWFLARLKKNEAGLADWRQLKS